MPSLWVNIFKGDSAKPGGTYIYFKRTQRSRRTQMRGVRSKGFPRLPVPAERPRKGTFSPEALFGCRRPGLAEPSGPDPAARPFFVPRGLCSFCTGGTDPAPLPRGSGPPWQILPACLQVINPVTPEKIGWQHLLIHDT